MADHDDMTADPGFAAGEPGFDDDRLLAFALGLDDDPQLAAAAESDAALRARLDAMRADVATIGAGLERVVPAPPDDYTDLGDERWRRVRGLLEAPATAASRRRPLWRRALAPAVALALVFVLGVAGVQYLGGNDGVELATEGAADKATEGDGDETGSAQEDSLGRTAGQDGGGAAARVREIADAASYAAVVVARAAPPGGSSQRFEVLRVLRQDDTGVEVGDLVELQIVDQTVEPERLVVLFLEPSPVPAPSTTAGAPAATATDGSELGVVEYEHRGTRALIVLLEAGTDPGAVNLP